ncbi:hypothetical protein CCACVL1_05735 [Corchorus capsularis]|uniref:Uncharacterized protein n=1 Tax=Corchorus capsularis TaxID=210143 RepID=A0A1R3JJB5_COCAP|nr:hypothetical protein CCACVL1_05735 [Corchorus capsularis]
MASLANQFESLRPKTETETDRAGWGWLGRGGLGQGPGPGPGNVWKWGPKTLFSFQFVPFIPFTIAKGGSRACHVQED